MAGWLDPRHKGEDDVKKIALAQAQQHTPKKVVTDDFMDK
jgi:hypothetical protein